jgi:hypothetical protein
MRAREGAQIAAGAMLASAERLPIAVWVRQMQGNAGGGSQGPSAVPSSRAKRKEPRALTRSGSEPAFAAVILEDPPSAYACAPYDLGAQANRVFERPQALMHPVSVRHTDDSGFEVRP